jgi:hypothetical protein
LWRSYTLGRLIIVLNCSIKKKAEKLFQLCMLRSAWSTQGFLPDWLLLCAQSVEHPPHNAQLKQRLRAVIHPSYHEFKSRKFQCGYQLLWTPLGSGRTCNWSA